MSSRATGPTSASRSTESVARWLQAALASTAVAGVVVAISGFARWRDSSFVIHLDPNGAGTGPLPAAGFGGGGNAGLSALSGALSIATIVLWLIWQHRATSNLWAWGLRDLRITPGWSIAWWFIPIADLWMPFVAVRELDRRSRPADDARRNGTWVAGWWAAYVAGRYGVLIGAVIAIARSFSAIWSQVDTGAAAQTIDLGPMLRAIAPWTVVAAFVTAVAAGLAIMVVRRIDEAQRVFAVTPPQPPRPDVAPV